MDTIHRGFLIKEGGQGHQYKNEKKRWFVLKDLFLFYYSGPPVPTKNMLKLKGIIYLPGCATKDNVKTANTFVLASTRKEYVLSSISANPTADILSWRNSLDYAIEQSQQFRNDESTTGWLMKKGAKGHNYQNWKKRWFILRGNCLFYYEEKDEEMEAHGWATVERLKGFIEISMITNIDADVSSDGNGFQFIVTVNNDKSYIFATKSLDEKNNWLSALRGRIERFSKSSLQVALNTCSTETPIKSGELRRHISIKNSVTAFFVLTNVNLRVYSSKPDMANLTNTWAKGLTSCIPLLGCSIQSSDDSDEWDLKPQELAIIEIQGHAYVLETAGVQERSEWVLALKTAARNLAKQVVEAGETIRLTCNASDKNDHNAGYTIMTIDQKQLQLKYLMLKKTVAIPFNKLKLVFLQPGFLFCLKYLQGEKAKQLKMKCGNASGIFDAVEAIFELVGSGATEMKRHSEGNSRALAHSSITGQELMENMQAATKAAGGKKPRKLTKEMILTQREIEEEAANQAALAGSFHDFHYDSAPTPSKKKPLKGSKAEDSAKRSSKKGLKHSSKQLPQPSGDSISTSPASLPPTPIHLPPALPSLPPTPTLDVSSLPPPVSVVNGSPRNTNASPRPVPPARPIPATGPPAMPMVPPRATGASFSNAGSAYSSSSDEE